MPEPELEGLTNFLYEMGLLKRYQRTGWMIAGIDTPESIAEHSFRTAIIGYLLAVMEGADPAKTAAMCLFHDTQETRIGDVPSVGKAYVVTAPNPEVTADQVADLPAAAGRAVRSLVEEYEARQRPEARLAKDADKLECLIQAREYQAQGHEDVPPWIETSAAALQSPAARRLAEACQQVPPRQWWKAVVESYPRPVKASRQSTTPAQDQPSNEPRPGPSEPEKSTNGLIPGAAAAFFSPAKLAAYTGSCFMLVGQPTQAREHCQEDQGRIPDRARGRGNPVHGPIGHPRQTLGSERTRPSTYQQTPGTQSLLPANRRPPEPGQQRGVQLGLDLAGEHHPT